MTIIDFPIDTPVTLRHHGINAVVCGHYYGRDYLPMIEVEYTNNKGEIVSRYVRETELALAKSAAAPPAPEG